MTITTNFLSLFITDIIDAFDHHLYVDKRGIDLFLESDININTIDKSKYQHLTRDEAILLDDYIEYTTNPKKVYNILNIPIWSQGDVRVKNVSGKYEDELTSTQKLYNTTVMSDYKLIYKLDQSVEYIFNYKHNRISDFTIKDLLAAYVSVRDCKYDRTFECFYSVNCSVNTEQKLFINIEFTHTS